jgi:hypothetical protein
VAAVLCFLWIRQPTNPGSDDGELRITYDSIRNETSVIVNAGPLAAAEVGTEKTPMSLTAVYGCDGSSSHCTPKFETLSIDCPSRDLPRVNDGVLVIDGTRFPVLSGIKGVAPIWWSPHAIRLVVMPGLLGMMVGFQTKDGHVIGGAKNVRGVFGEVAFQMSDDNLSKLRKFLDEQFTGSAKK